MSPFSGGLYVIAQVNWLAQVNFQDFFNAGNIAPLIRVGVFLFIALPLVLVVSRIIRRVLKGRVTPQHAMLASKLFTYTFVGILLVMVLRELGFKLTALLGAAGILGVAVGFAAQTSLSNLISGIFLVSEQTFQVGDVIRIGTTTGTVKSVDLLSIKLRTFDNQLIRIPNETLVKSEMSNITAFGIRRLDIPIGVAYGTDLKRVMALLTEIADANPLILDEPRPLVNLTGFGDSSISINFGVWFAKPNWYEVRNDCIIAIHDRFQEECIEIPFPQRTIHVATSGPPPGTRRAGVHLA